jgi:signal transduction histidine kinase
LLKRSKESSTGRVAGEALRAAGVGVVEVDDWREAAGELDKCQAALVVCSGDLLDGVDTTRITRLISSLTSEPGASSPLSRDAARALSHELRTPLSAMAGWVHLMETGKLDEAGLKRAITRLRGNIDDQVRTIERFLGATHHEGHGQ